MARLVRTEIDTIGRVVEKKYAIANLLRGVPHEVNNTVGSVLPLLQ